MTDKLLGIIAINLTIITGLMVLQSIPTATAHTGEMDWSSEYYESDFKRAVFRLVGGNCYVEGTDIIC